MKEQYAYGVARTHVREGELLDRAALEQLIAADGYAEAVQLLAEHGYTGDGQQMETLLRQRRQRLWDFLAELGVEPEALRLFRYEADFQNLKAAIKAHITGEDPAEFLVDTGNLPPETVQKAVQEKAWNTLPPAMARAGQEAMELLLQTQDGQACDLLLDRETLAVLYAEGQASPLELVREYARLRVALTDIKIAVRCCMTGKPAPLIQRSLAPCQGLDCQALALAAAKGLEEIYGYLAYTEYAGAVEALKESPTAFEKWCDNQIMALIRPEKGKSFTLAPIIAYLLAVENEIKTVRLVLVGKLNQLSEHVIRERIRDIYG